MIIRVLLLITLLGPLFTSEARSAEVFPRRSTWRFLKGESEASKPASAWRGTAFDDSNWDEGQAPFYYGEPLSGTLLGDMNGNYTGVFIRKTFVVSNPAAIENLTLESLSDDGYVAWINGHEVARYNMPEGDPIYNQTSLGPLSEPIPWETFAIENPAEILVPGMNVLAVQAFNTSLGGSSDFSFDASLSSTTDIVPPTVENLIPPAGALIRNLNTIEVIFSEPVSGVEPADLLMNGTPATNLTSFGAADYVFTFAVPPPGEINVTWSETSGIRDLSAGANPFSGEPWTYTLDPNAPLAQLVISEFMADNDNTIRDEDGDGSDWIEVFNPTTESVDLSGWFLTDTTNNLALWRFPSVNLGPNSYLVVFASEKNRTNPASPLHTNFKLSASGGFLALVDPESNAVSYFQYPEQREDVSYGRDRGNPTVVGYFPKPTPGNANVPGGPGFAPEVHFSRAGGTFTSGFQLELSTTSSNAVIRYTIGKSLPDENSPIYSTPISISTTTQVRARAFEAGLLPGDPHSESYILLSSALVNTTSDLPIVVFHNYAGGSVPATGEQFVMMQIFEPKNGVTSMTNAPDLSERARFRRRGSSTQDYPKWSLALETWNEFDDDKKVSILGMPEESDWVFYAPNNFEPVLIHNPFMYQLSRDIGRYASRTRFAEVYLNTGGGAIQQANYFGIYVIEEKIKRGPDRVDIDALRPEHLKPPEVTGGYILKIDRPDPGDFPFSAAGQELNYVEPKGPEIRTAARAAQKNYIEGYFSQFGSALNGANFRDPVNGYAKFVDVPSWIDYHLLDVLAFNVDALRLSTYLYKPREGKITFGPLWDFDRALGSTDGRDANPSTWGDTGGISFFAYPWWGRLFRDPDFYQKWIDRWEELRRNQLSTTNMNRLIDELTGEVRKAQPREQARWRITPRGGSYQAEVNLLKSYLARRTSFIDAQFVRPPAPSLAPGKIDPGSSLTFSGPSSATIYFTLDGSDPRLPGGALSPNAIPYTGPISIGANTPVNARSRNPSHALGPVKPSPIWSGIYSATYVVATPALAVTEILYNPSALPGSTNSPQDFEFIELKNVGATALDLAGFAFTNGISFQFTSRSLAPGARTVIVKSRAAFEQRYGTSIPIAGEFTGSLDNKGEQITLLGPLQEPVWDFDYSNTWYPVTDGHGFSLVLNDENAPFDSFGSASAWRASALPNGSPGASDSTPPRFPKVFVNELRSHSTAPRLDTVELYNSESIAADIGGWYLTDDFASPKQFKIPSGTSIPAGGYMTFDETHFNTGSKKFALSAAGEELYLFSADSTGELTGYVQGFEFGASANGVTLGRYVSGDQNEHFVAQSMETFGRTNSGPRLGPVIMSEVMFHPVQEADEYIELRNISPQTIQLFDPLHATNTWRLRGGSDFDFPEGAWIPEGGFALVVSFDPANTATAESFRSRFGLPASVTLYGPLSGNLSNSGDRLTLMRPDGPADDGSVPYIVVDELNYLPSSPWPSGANGTGSSIERLSGSFGDDPGSWAASTATPGRISPGTNPDVDGDGLPDFWEIAHALNPNDASGANGPTGDPDADGATNLQEYLSGTRPGDPASRLAVSASRAGDTTRLSFNAAADCSYSIFYRTSLASGSWVKLADIPAGNSERPQEIIDAVPGSMRFYRVVTPQQ